MYIPIERIKQISDTTTSVKNRNRDQVFHYNSCGGCNTCHQMTGIHTMTDSSRFGGTGEGGKGPNLQKPCATNFFQRNMGNSYMQSISENRQALGSSISGSRVPTIQRKCSCGGSCSSCSEEEEELQGIQTKLTVGSPNDVYEQEADRVADHVMRMPTPQNTGVRGQMSKAGIGYKPGQTEDHTSVGFSIRRIAVSGDNNLETNSVSSLNKSGGRPLSTSTLKFMEPRFGADFGHVRLHTDEHAHETASQIKARAFTYGHHIWLGRGAYEGDKCLIAHELTHVVQQNENNLTNIKSSEGETKQVLEKGLPATPGKIHNAGRKNSYFDGYLALSKVSGVIQREGVSVYSKSPGESSSTGHAFVSLENSSGEESYYGFYPACTGCIGTINCSDWELAALFPLNPIGVAGIVCDDRSHSFDSRMDYTINTSQYRSAKQLADEYNGDPPRYHLIGYQCVDFAIEIARSAGVSPPSAGWFVFTPQEFTENISEAENNQRSCVMGKGACIRALPAGIPEPVNIREYNSECRSETGYGGPDIFPSESECSGSGL